MSEQAHQTGTGEVTAGDQLRDAAAVVAISGALRDAAAELSCNPLSEPAADRMRALLHDPGLIHARRALARLVDGPTSEQAGLSDRGR